MSLAVREGKLQEVCVFVSVWVSAPSPQPSTSASITSGTNYRKPQLQAIVQAVNTKIHLWCLEWCQYDASGEHRDILIKIQIKTHVWMS